MDQPSIPSVSPAVKAAYEVGREIRRNPCSETLQVGMQSLYRSAESTFRIIHQEGEAQFGRPRACKQGCSHCCYQPVIAAPLEIVHMADVAEKTLTSKQLGDLVNRLSEYNSLRHEDRKASELAACPMLINESCSLYEARPITCRAHHSYDLSECIQLRTNPDYETSTPSTDAIVIDMGAAIRGGLGRTLGKVQVFLGEALFLLLSDPDWRMKWANFSLDFSSAKVGSSEEGAQD